MNKTPFKRAIAMMAAIAAVMSGPSHNLAAIAQIGGYESRGKGGKRAHRVTGIAAQKRAALKARNIARNRRAHRN